MQRPTRALLHILLNDGRFWHAAPFPSPKAADGDQIAGGSDVLTTEPIHLHEANRCERVTASRGRAAALSGEWPSNAILFLGVLLEVILQDYRCVSRLLCVHPREEDILVTKAFMDLQTVLGYY